MTVGPEHFIDVPGLGPEPGGSDRDSDGWMRSRDVADLPPGPKHRRVEAPPLVGGAGPSEGPILVGTARVGPPAPHPVSTLPEGPTGRDPGDSVYLAAGGRWAAVELDRPLPDFEPRPSSGPSYRPDTIFDGWSSDSVRMRLASVRGYAHRFSGRPREDDVAVALHEATGAMVFAVADGVSAAEQSCIGATLACRTAVDAVVAQLDAGRRADVVDWGSVVRQAAWQLAEHAARIRGLPNADSQEAERLLATTLVAGVAMPTPVSLEVALVSVGDSGAWLLRNDDYERITETASEGADGVASSAVVALPRVPRVVQVHQVTVYESERLLVGTDGFGAPLGDGTGPVGQLFAHHLRRPPEPRGLAHLLDFSRETFDDDRTLLVIWPNVPSGVVT